MNKVFRYNIIVLLIISVMISGSVMAQNRGFIVLPDDESNGDDFQLYNGSYALLVGVSNYTNGWNDLDQVPEELDAARKALVLHGFDVTMELKRTSAKELPGVFTNFLNLYGYGQNNRLVFIYSGHGHSWGKHGYLVPSDAPIPEDGYPGEEFLSKALNIGQIMEWSRQMTARHALFLFDSCFSGTIFNTKGGLDDARKRTGKRFDLTSAKRSVRQFITAGSAGETVPADSIFMPAFVDAITLGEADLYKDGVITGVELGLYLQNEVAQYSDQSPQYGTHSDRDLAKGDFVFVMAKTREAAVEVTPVGRPVNSGVLTTIREETTRTRPLPDEVLAVQTVLKAKGYYNGPVDGIWGPASRAALGAMATDADRDRKALIQSIVESGIGDVASVPGMLSGQGVSRSSTGVSGRNPVKHCDACPAMVRIPGGSFQRGSIDGHRDETPVQRVTVQTFEISETEVTFDQYDVFANDTDRELPDDNAWGRGNRPVINVSWVDAVAYGEWLSKLTGEQYRLPTEAEWEYVARAGTTTKYWWGEDIGQNRANCVGCGSQWDNKQTALVKSFAPNPFGLYDTAGNVAEWVLDCHRNGYENAPRDGSQLVSGSQNCSGRVIRGGSWSGGSWNYEVSDIRSSNRYWRYRRDRVNYVGFRLAKSL